MLQLGEALGKTLEEIGRMPVAEAHLWLAYFQKKAKAAPARRK